MERGSHGTGPRHVFLLLEQLSKKFKKTLNVVFAFAEKGHGRSHRKCRLVLEFMSFKAGIHSVGGQASGRKRTV